jgi:succinoglycan biosynthesis protein ExoV
MGLPDVHDGSWSIGFVRGPKTAELLGLPASAAICDAAILLRTLELPEAAGNIDVAFMPHYESLERGFWAEACRLAGIKLIDATAPVEQVLAEIKGARLLITEAMHGAIVADALRTPWIGVKPIYRGHHMKWLDWSGALSIDLRMHRLLPSSLLELYVGMTGRGGEEGRSGQLNKSALSALPNRALTYLAARRLAALSTQDPQLSADAAIAGATAAALEKVESFVQSRR